MLFHIYCKIYWYKLKEFIRQDVVGKEIKGAEKFFEEKIRGWKLEKKEKKKAQERERESKKKMLVVIVLNFFLN